MNITKENIDSLNAEIKISIDKQDYEENIKKSLTDIKRKAQMPGFRPGKVPMNLITKIYGQEVKIEEINKIVTKALNDYIEQEKIDIIGDPIPGKNQQKIDIENSDTFEFVFDIGIKPEIDLKISEKDKFIRYDINPDEKSIQKYIDSYCKNFGTFKNIEAADADSLIKGDLTEIDSDGNDIENGIKIENANIFISAIKDEENKNKLIGAKVNDTIIFNPKKAYQSDDEVAYLLKLSKNKAELNTSDFKIVVKEILKYQNASIDQELFDKVFGEGNVKSEEEFKNKITEKIKEDLKEQANIKLKKDITEYFIKKTKIELPTEFLKRWIILSEKNITEEQIEKEFPLFEQNLKWQLIESKIIKDFDIKAEQEEIQEFAKKIVREQFKSYGIPNIPDQLLENYSKEMINKNEKKVKDIYYQVLYEKVFDTIINNCKIDSKEISLPDYEKLIEKENKKSE